jgi:hypothetical protein
MRLLEHKLHTGLVLFPNPATLAPGEKPEWRQIESLGALPTHRPARILLFCHGTFSSSFGSFAGLETSDFLRRAWEPGNYDIVVGYDHKSLSLDPKENAQDLSERLKPTLDSLPKEYPPVLDAVCYSRGGLVFRSLAETIAPEWSWNKVVFVAAPNGGTHLASPKNWKRLVDLYTNLTLAAGYALSPISPHAIAVAEFLRGLGAFVKYLATEVIDEKAVPGLAAMQPGGSFVGTLNQSALVHPPSATYTIASSFEPKSSSEPFFQKLVAVLLDEALFDPLFQRENDTVVDTASSGELTPNRVLQEAYLFPPERGVYHLNYFVQDETRDHLTRWLV